MNSPTALPLSAEELDHVQGGRQWQTVREKAIQDLEAVKDGIRQTAMTTGAESLDDGSLDLVTGGADAEPQDAFMWFSAGGPAAAAKSEDAFFVRCDRTTMT